MSLRHLRMFVRMMPVIESEERMTAVNVGAISSGMMKEREQRKILQGWRQAAEIADEQQRPPKDMLAAVLSMKGIKVD